MCSKSGFAYTRLCQGESFAESVWICSSKLRRPTVAEVVCLSAVAVDKERIDKVNIYFSQRLCL